MSVGRYAYGVASLLITVGALIYASTRLRHSFLNDWTGAPARLAEAIGTLALLIAVAEMLGAIGALHLGPITIVSALIGLGSHRAADTARARVARVSGSRSFTGTTAIALAAATVVIAAWVAPTIESYDHGIRGLDSLWYHLPWAASFAQTGQITHLRFTDVEYLSQFYPATSELVHAVGIVWLGRDALSPLLNLLWLGLTLLAAYCIGRPRGLGGLTLLGAAVAFVTPTMIGSQAGSAANDTLGVAFLLSSIALLIHANRRGAVVVAGVAAGLAAGTKLNLLAPVAALTVALLAMSWSGRRRATVVAWFVPMFAAGGYWYLRNLIAVGNPLPWVSLPLLATPRPALQQHTGYSVIHYATDTHIWTHVFGPGLVSGLGPWWPLVLGAVVFGPVLCLRPPAERITRALGAVALASLLAYLVTPESAAGPLDHPLAFAFNIRYAAPALVLSLTALPLAPVFAARRELAAAVLAALFVLTAINGHLWSSSHLVPALAIAVAVALVAVTVARRPAPARALARATALLAALVIAGYPWELHYLDGRYAFQPGISALSRAWALFRQIHDARVAVAGTFGQFFSYPFDGLDLSNRVQYIAAHGPHGSFTPIGSCPAWRAAVNAGGYRYVVMTPNRDPWDPKHLTTSPEQTWISSTPAALPVQRHVTRGHAITVYRITAPLDPRTCPG